MSANQPLTSLMKLFITLLLVGLLQACNLFEEGDIEAEGGDIAPIATMGGGDITFGAARYIPWLPWYFAEQDGVFQQYGMEYGIDISFQSGSYDALINQFVGGELSAIAMTNIDAMANLIQRNIQADVILISSYSWGNDAILLQPDASDDIVDQVIAVRENTVSQYLLERYMLKNQIHADEIELALAASDAELEAQFTEGDAIGVSAWNPIVENLKRNTQAKVLFDSHEIPKEIFHVVLVRRDVLEENPLVGKTLLATWFTVMERLQGNARGTTLDALASIAGLERPVFDAQFESIQLASNPTQALSILRDRQIRKTMRHIRYFMERHELAVDVPIASWVSYPGRTPNLMHFNANPLQEFLESPL